MIIIKLIAPIFTLLMLALTGRLKLKLHAIDTLELEGRPVFGYMSDDMGFYEVHVERSGSHIDVILHELYHVLQCEHMHDYPLTLREATDAEFKAASKHARKYDCERSRRREFHAELFAIQLTATLRNAIVK